MAFKKKVKYSINGTQNWETVGSDFKSTQHSVLLDNLEPSTLYNLVILSGGILAEYQILTNSIIDITPPQILNFAVFNNADEYLSISWYTDEKATEKVIIDKDGNVEEINSNELPINKNHLYVLDNLSSGNYKIRVYSEDSSGNGNFSEYISVKVSALDDSTINGDETASDDDSSQESIFDSLLSPRNQIVILTFMILLVVSLFRAYPGGKVD